MGSSIKIKKSKYLSYQKQGFLYLVFILFLFFSQAGEYVMHYLTLAKTQGALNEYLEERLDGLLLEDESANAYRDRVLKRVKELDQINVSFETYKSQSIAGLDQFRENQFAERIIRRGDLSDIFNQLWLDQVSESKASLTEERLTAYDGRTDSPTDFFFKETPNAVVPSLVEHAKTTFLVEALEELNKQALVFEQFKMERLEEASFTSVYKRRLFLGENFELNIQSLNDQDSVENVTINSIKQGLTRREDGAQLFYRPQKWGKYFVEIQTRSQRFYTSFEVVKPRIRFIAQEEIIDLTLGNEQLISIDPKLIPSTGYAFESDFATNTYENGVLSVKPTTAGEFTLRLSINGQAMDSIKLGSRLPQDLTVMLSDAKGDPSDFAHAHRVQSTDTDFQVLSYTAVYYPKNGTPSSSYNSTSRLLRPELQGWSTEGGGTLVIKDIQLLSSNGKTRVKAQPLIVTTDG